MYDGFGLDYLRSSSMPASNGIITQGFYIRNLQAITKAREAAEKVGDRETVMKLV